MTRINLVPVEELSDQHLIREYNELPRCIKQDIDTSNAPERYCLGAGHMKWAKHRSKFLIDRYDALCREMEYRNFTVNYPVVSLYRYYRWHTVVADNNDYTPDDTDLVLSRARIKERVQMKPDWYRWTKRTKPKYL